MKKTIPLKLQNQLERLGSAVQSIRAQRKLGQQDVAEAIGFSSNTIVNIENGTGSSLSTFLVLLEHYGIADDVIEAVQSHIDKTKPVPSRVRKEKISAECADSSMAAPSPSLIVSESELFPNDQPVNLVDAIRDQDLLSALQTHPENVYRVNRNYAMRLARSEEHLDIAIYSHTVDYVTPGGGSRQREVYYATSIEGAAKHKLNWTMGGINRNPLKAVDAILCPDEIDGAILPLTSSGKDELLLKLRKVFTEHGVFVDRVVMGQPGRTKQHYLRKSNRPVKGEVYQALYRTTLAEWLVHQSEVKSQEGV